ncbi:hypothetical protein Gotur_003764 [Gossypium turneri]
MVNLHNVGTFNADTRFKAGYLNELEKMLEKALPNAMLKAKPNIESRIRLLKRDWSIVYDMLNGQNNSGFGWDEHRQLVVAEDAAWNSYLNSHKEAGQFRHHSFPYYEQLTAIYAQDRATADVSLDDMDVSATEPQLDRNQGGSSSSKKKKKNSDASDNISSSFHEAATLLVENMRAIGEQISLTVDERYRALSKIPDHPTQMLVFFSLPSNVRLEWIIMSGVSESNVSSQASRGTKRKWVPEEDAALVSCMVDLHNVGTFNADTGFKTGYLNELEKMLEKALPNAMFKARPNIESRIRLLKRDWSILYDMLNGQNNSGFGWDEHRQLVVAEDAIWNSYLNSHKEAGQFKHRSFPYYDQLTAIYARDRATRKDVQTATDVIEEINVQNVPTTDINEERNEFYDCEADVSLDDMDVSATEPQPDRNQGAIDEQISRSIASDVVVQQKSEEFQIIKEKAINLYPTLCEIEGLTVDERYRALSKIPDHPTQMPIFFSLPSDVRLE